MKSGGKVGQVILKMKLKSVLGRYAELRRLDLLGSVRWFKLNLRAYAFVFD